MNIAIILSGGTGIRLGCNIPKQYIAVKGKPIIGYCLDVFAENTSVDAIQIVADVSWRDYIASYVESCGHRNELLHKIKGFSEPGANRQLSIFNALADVRMFAAESDYVMIHDAARPLVADRFISRCFESVCGHDGVMPALPMKDTVYMSEDGEGISSLLDRRKIFAGQAPEAFLLGKYYAANLALLPEDILSINGSTEPAIRAGMDIVMIDGDENNFKITTKEDLARFEQQMKGNNL